MLSVRPLLASVLLLLGGCAHLNQTTPRQPKSPKSSELSEKPVLHAERSALSQIYVFGDPQLRPASLANALRAGLTARGFNVRAAEGNAPAGDGGIAATRITRDVAEGHDPPDSSRALAYLHPNAPRLILLVGIGIVDAPAMRKDHSLRVGAIFADTLDGSILWSSRLEEEHPSDDRELRRLADRLLATLPPPQS